MSEKSNLWELIKAFELDSDGKEFDYSSFRSIGGFNGKLASWDPLEHSSRYYKSLLYSFSQLLDNKIFLSNTSDIDNRKIGDGLNQYLKNIKGRDLGCPTTIKYGQNFVDIDYLLSCEEMFFLQSKLEKVESVLEIGPGFGRLPHSILQNFENITAYYIIDLPWMIEISRNFLGNVLDISDFNKIKFIDVNEFNSYKGTHEFLENMRVDLAINIDSFQEMPTDIAEDYLGFIAAVADSFYSKNAICKYKPESIDVNLVNSSQYEVALNMGLCKQVIDIFDSNAISEQKKIYLEKFCPEGFVLEKEEQCYGQLLYYQSALYSKASVG